MNDKEKVTSFWKYYFGRLPNSERGLNMILKEYSGENRHYHGLSHLVHGLTQFDDLPNIPIADEEALVLAWACHDLKYNTTIPDFLNVKASAKRALLLARTMEFAHKEERTAVRAVLATSHKNPPENIVEQAILDLDLSILGADKFLYENYEMNIRKEYGWVPFEDYKKTRISVLSKFLEKDRLFWIDSFHQKYDSARKENLAWSIHILNDNIDFLREK